MIRTIPCARRAPTGPQTPFHKHKTRDHAACAMGSPCSSGLWHFARSCCWFVGFGCTCHLGSDRVHPLLRSFCTDCDASPQLRRHHSQRRLIIRTQNKGSDTQQHAMAAVAWRRLADLLPQPSCLCHLNAQHTVSPSAASAVVGVTVQVAVRRCECVPQWWSIGR